jgi:hypothetical protein
MPDDRGVFHGQGWSRRREEGWDRAFRRQCRHDWRTAPGFCWCVRCDEVKVLDPAT